MLRIFRYLTVTALLLWAGAAVAQTARKVKTPDFAYPETVSTQARKNLATALAAGNSEGVLRSLLDYTLARSSVSAGNLPASLALVDSVVGVSSDPVLRAMLLTLEAELYNNVYQSSRWKYDRRTAPLFPLPADYTEWSGQQFRHTISSLVDSALTDSAALRAVPLASYKSAVSQDHYTTVYYPTIYNFVITRAIDMMTDWGDVSIGRVLSLYDLLIASSSVDSAPGVNARLGRLVYEMEHRPESRVFSSDGYMQSPLMELYRSYLTSAGKPATQYAGDILLEVPVYGVSYRRELYDYIVAFLKDCPAYWRKDCLLGRLNQMKEREVSLTSPLVTGPGREVELKMHLTNVDRLTVDIYDVSSSPVTDFDFTFTSGMAGARRVASLPVEVSGERVPFDVTRSVTYSFDRPGTYVAVPVVAGNTIRRRDVRKIHVTGIALCVTSFLDRTVWAVDAENGAPLPDVTVSVNTAPYSKGSVTRKVGVTDAEGSVVVTDSRGVIVASKGTDRYALPLHIYGYNYDRPDKWIMAVNGYTSLPVYHLGDTARWVAVCYEYKGGLSRPYASRQVKAVLYDANSVAVDTLDVTTDRFGRATGEFALPADGLTGRFQINVDGRGGLGFEVSDYKLPTFMVSAPRVEQDAPAPGCVTLRGKVETYAGFPLADAEVSMDLSVAERPRWWYPSSSYNVYAAKARTDASGRYEIVIPDSVFASSPIPAGYYTAAVSVLSSAGETQTGSVSFGRSERYIIKADIPASFDLTKGRMPIDVRVVNYEDSLVGRSATLSIQRADSVAVAVRDIRGRDDMHVSALAQGVYNVVITCADADTLRRQLILYNPSATESPVRDELLWSPDWSLKVDGRSGDGSWLYAAGCDTHVLATVWTPDSVVSRRWVEARKGFNRLDVSLPKGIDKATLTVMATGGYCTESRDITVTRADSGLGLKIVAESFRDRTVPGSDETWTFRIVDTRGDGREAAVIADMYNTALDAIARSDWNLHITRGYQPGLRCNTSDIAGRSSYYISIPVGSGRTLRCPSLEVPSFNTYGRPLSSYLNGGWGLRNMKMSRAMGAVEMAECDMVADMGDAPMLTGAVNGLVREHKEEITVEESAAEAISVADSEGGVARKNAPAFTYRDSNVPLAFFRPSLVTDSDGRLELKFTVPDANTTWGFRALAFTDSLISANFSRDVVASKDIMVQPNLPRFLRTGDVAVIRASVMNATGDMQHVMTDVEIFNPTDGSSILTLHRPDTIAAHGSAIVETTLTVPSGMTMVGYRVKSSTSAFADGEQALIPVLPSVTPVIETIPFYIDPSQSEYKASMPSMPSDGHVTLQFCENPVWYVVTALPGLLQNESSTAPDAARAIFSAAVASGLLRDNPAIAEALKEWSGGDGSSEMLTSMLERNEELKTVLLNATPWMLDARNDTERMTRLSLLFDSKTIDKTITDNIALLSRLSCKEGGWSWCAGYPDYSEWATRRVLAHMGRLVQLGFMPDNSALKKMLQSALEHDTKMTLKDFRKYPDGDYTSYVYLHDMFARAAYGAPDSRIVNAVTQKILAGWKSAPLAVKAVDAQVLYRHNYRTVAGSILESIHQFGVTSPGKGMYFPSLDNAWYGSMDKLGITALILETFHMIEPGCADIDLLRQWLIIQKGAQNWGSSSAATDVVAAVLTTSGRWVTEAKGAELKIGGKRLRPESYERLTGEFEVSLPAKEVSGKELTVRKSSDSPAWGAVYCRYESDMTDVRAYSCPELSIEKSIPDSMKVGERVTVRLTLKVDADMDYVAIIDDRPACLEPVDQLPAPVYAEGLRFYRENRDSSTRIFIDRLPKGTYVLSYDVWVNNAGSYTSGIASVQSQYAPRYSAGSAGHAVIANE